ncbi:hypothetical protein AB1Y20_004551 [Prymnesium parvum]|uniref:Acyl-coenzyme A thioesterase THEM4 n=1 Tax=Prymnesium parvum TaxID=97485 RepID=A0AB34IZG0_PRYPA
MHPCVRLPLVASPVAFATGIALGSFVTLLLTHKRLRRPPYPASLLRLRKAELTGSARGAYFNAEDAPEWLRGLFFDPALQRVLLREWEDAAWRRRAGWLGTDLIHNPEGNGVQVVAYFWDAAALTLTGVVKFGPAAESHRGLCHGGAMTSLMDDLCGHICFFSSGTPWCGATVQVNCKLMKPVRVGDVHKLVGRIDRQETKEKGGKPLTKVFISAELVGERGEVFASLEGLSIVPVVMSTIDDAVSKRSWISSDGVLRDSGWLL